MKTRGVEKAELTSLVKAGHYHLPFGGKFSTPFCKLKSKDIVNVEFDMIGKYLNKIYN